MRYQRDEDGKLAGAGTGFDPLETEHRRIALVWQGSPDNKWAW